MNTRRFVFDASIENYSPSIEEEILESISGWSDYRKYYARLCLEEAVANAIEHGNKGTGKITLWYRFRDDLLTAAVKDQGEGFDLDSVPDPTTEENREADHGRGIWLMRIYANELRYNKKGNIVLLKFLRTKQQI
ncbi:MAG: ATP-binding protein [Nanoarchaeota archaeon]